MTPFEKKPDNRQMNRFGNVSFAPTTAIVSAHRDFSKAVLEHLIEIGISENSRSFEGAVDTEQLKKLHPNLAFVDWDILTADEGRFYRALTDAAFIRTIIVLCSTEQTAFAAQAIRDGEAYDYLLTDYAPDPNRLRLILERTQSEMNRAAKSEEYDLEKQRTPQAIDLLQEIKTLLKSDLTSPAVKALYDFESNLRGSLDRAAMSDAEQAEMNRNNLVDLLCKKLQRLESEICSQGKKSTPEKSRSNSSILIVEDDRVSADLAQKILKRNGYDAVIASSDGKAIYELSRQQFALVLLDIHLGEDNGLNVVRMMRANADMKHVPVIVITSDRQRDTLFVAAELQVQGYLLKPYRPEELMNKVKNALLKEPERQSMPV